MRQVVNAPVRSPCHAGTDEGDRSLAGRKGSMHPARGSPERSSLSPRSSLSFSLTLSFSISFPRAARSSSSFSVVSSHAVPLPLTGGSPSSLPHPRRLSSGVVLRLHSPRFPLSFGVSFFFSSRLFLLAATADAQPVLHRQIDSTLRTSRWNERGSSSRIPEFAPVG